MHALHVFISGRVQGVSYRASTVLYAKKLGLVGYVKNLSDGTVEALAEGEKAVLEEFLKWCYQGPRLAKVDQVKSQWKEASGLYQDFLIR